MCCSVNRSTQLALQRLVLKRIGDAQRLLQRNLHVIRAALDAANAADREGILSALQLLSSEQHRPALNRLQTETDPTAAPSSSSHSAENSQDQTETDIGLAGLESLLDGNEGRGLDRDGLQAEAA